jgi:hypothetical protein
VFAIKGRPDIGKPVDYVIHYAPALEEDVGASNLRIADKESRHLAKRAKSKVLLTLQTTEIGRRSGLNHIRTQDLLRRDIADARCIARDWS